MVTNEESTANAQAPATITIPLFEPDSSKYIYVHPETNRVHLMMPVVSGTEIGLDNTCKSVVALKEFFETSEEGALEHLKHYQQALEFDLAILSDTHPLYALKKDRLDQVKCYQTAIEALQYDSALRRLNETQPEYPDALKQLMTERSNLYSMVLRPKITDHFLRTVNPVFSVRRDGCILHTMPLDKAKQTGLTHCYVWDGSDLTYIQSNGDAEHVELINQQTFLDELSEISWSKKGQTIQLSANEMNRLITSNTQHIPTDNDQVLYQSLQDAYQHISLQGAAERLKQAVLTSQQGKADVDFSSIQQTLTNTFQSMFGVTVHLLVPKDPTQPDQDLVAATKNYLDNELRFDNDTTAEEYINALIHYFARHIWDEIPAFKSPFSKISNDAATAPSKLSILTQFFLAEINMYCFSHGMTQANFGKILDESKSLGDLVAATVIKALADGMPVERAVCQFINDHATSFQLEPSRNLTPEDMQTIETQFITHYTTVADSAELDEFLILDTSKPGKFVTHNGAICTDLSEFIAAGFSRLDTPYLKDIRAEFEHINGVVPHKNIPSTTIDIEAISGLISLFNKPQVLKHILDTQKTTFSSVNTPANSWELLFLLIQKWPVEQQIFLLKEMKEKGYDLDKPIKIGYTPAMLAAEQGHAAVIQALHAAGADLDKPSSIFGLTPARIAALHGHAAVIQALHAAGANLDKPDKNGETPASIAAAQGHVAVIQALHAAGANLDKPDNDGWTPALVAALEGRVAVIQALHAAGVDLDKPDKNGDTPALVAALYGHAAAIQALHAAGADLNQPDKNGDTPASIAAVTGHAAVIQALHAAEVNLDKPINNGYTPASRAALRGHAAVIQALHAAGVNLTKPDKNGNTPASIAAAQDHVAVIQALHAAGADLNQPDKNGDTPASIAARQGQVAVIQALHAAGANLNQPDKNGNTPASMAAQHASAAVIQALHAAGADLDKLDNNGRTPATIAAERGYSFLIQTLHDAGANLDKLDNNDRTPATIAAERGYAAVIKALYAAGADLNQPDSHGCTPAMYAARHGHDSVIKALHAARADLDKPNKHGETPAIEAAFLGHATVIHALHAAGANLDKPDNDGNTPALVAALQGHVAVIQALHAAGVDLDKPDNDGRTPAMIAAEEDEVDVIQALYDAGADLNQPDKNGNTPASIAAKHGHDDVIKALHAVGVGLIIPASSEEKTTSSTTIITSFRKQLTSIRSAITEKQAESTYKPPQK